MFWHQVDTSLSLKTFYILEILFKPVFHQTIKSFYEE